MSQGGVQSGTRRRVRHGLPLRLNALAPVLVAAAHLAPRDTARLTLCCLSLRALLRCAAPLTDTGRGAQRP